MLITVHGTTPKNSSIDVQHWTALMSRSLSAIHRSITTPSMAIFMIASSGMPSVETYCADRASFRLHVGILAFQAVDAAEDFRQVEGLDRDAVDSRSFSL